MILFALTIFFLALGIKNVLFLIPLFFVAVYLFKKKNTKSWIIFVIAISIFLIVIILLNIPPSSYALVISCKNNYAIVMSGLKRFYIDIEGKDIDFLDLIKINGEFKDISFQTLEGEFNFQRYLYNNMVEQEIIFNDFEYVFRNPIRIKSLMSWLTQNLNSYSKYLISSLFFSINIDSQCRDLLQIFNVGFIFSISSIHLYLLNKIIVIILKFFRCKKAELISTIALLPFIYLQQFKVSSIKVFAFCINNNLLNKKYSRNQVLALLLSSTMIFNLRIIFTTTFYYVFIMSFLMPFVFSSLNLIKKRNKKYLVPIVLNFVFMPLTMIYEGQYNLLNPLVSLISTFISEILLLLSILMIFFKPVSIIINFISNIYFGMITFLGDYSFSLYISQSIIIIIIITLIIISLYFLEIGFFKGTGVTLFFIYITVFIGASPLDSYLSSYIAFINVGQGDSCLIHDHDKNILIDTGGSIYKDIANDVLMPFFKKKHIDKLDLVFISHNDYDHNGALESLSNHIEIDKIITGSNFYQENIGNLIFYNLNRYDIGSEENSESSVIYFYFKNRYFLMMGDAEKSIEEKIVKDNPDLNVDILKVGHHGSNTSTSELLLSSYRIEEAVISVGYNFYGHPSDEVIYRLNNYNITIRRTDKEGTIYY